MLDFRKSHILTAFAKSVSPHSYKGRMKSDWKRTRLAGRHSHLAVSDTMTAPPPEPGTLDIRERRAATKTDLVNQIRDRDTKVHL